MLDSFLPQFIDFSIEVTRCLLKDQAGGGHSTLGFCPPWWTWSQRRWLVAAEFPTSQLLIIASSSLVGWLILDSEFENNS